MNIFDLIRNFDSLNHKAIAEHLARNDTAMFVEACLTVAKADVPAWFADVQRHLRLNERVSAIKLVRTETGMGLKEAKDTCDLFDGRSTPYNPQQVSIDMASRMRAWAGVAPLPDPVPNSAPQAAPPPAKSPTIGATLYIVRDDDRYIEVVTFDRKLAQDTKEHRPSNTLETRHLNLPYPLPKEVDVYIVRDENRWIDCVTMDEEFARRRYGEVNLDSSFVGATWGVPTDGAE